MSTDDYVEMSVRADEVRAGDCHDLLGEIVGSNPRLRAEDLIAHQRKITTSRWLDALDAVLKLHQPFTTGVLEGDCVEGTCDHAGKCPTVPFTCCAACNELAEKVDEYYAEEDVSLTAWPCPTVQAINEALGVDR